MSEQYASQIPLNILVPNLGQRDSLVFHVLALQS